MLFFKKDTVPFIKDNTVFFTGHRSFYCPSGTQGAKKLEDLICSLYQKGYKNFIAGGAIGFDTMAAECVYRAKHKCPDMRLILMLPCKNQDAKWGYDAKRLYKITLECADKIIYVSENYNSGCMLKRNRAMVDASSLGISYCKKNEGGTAYTISYAEKNGVTIFNFANCITTGDDKFPT